MLLIWLGGISHTVRRRRAGGDYLFTREELDKLIRRERHWRKRKKVIQEERQKRDQEIQNEIEIALLKAKGLWVEPEADLPPMMLPPELAGIPMKPLDPRLIGALTNRRSPDEDDIEILVLMQ